MPGHSRRDTFLAAAAALTLTLPFPVTTMAAEPTASPAMAPPQLPGIGDVMNQLVQAGEIAGAVTVVADRDGLRHLECTGMADVASARPMTAETLFWIASMTKPVTGVAVAMLIDEGRIGIDDPVERFIPEFQGLSTPAGRPARLTIRQILTHTSGLGEASPQATRQAGELADLVPVWLAAPMKNEPGARWAYTQSGINLAGRIVEVVSGRRFDVFLGERLFTPLGMVDTTFAPSEDQRQRLATGYARNLDTGRLEPAPPRAEYGQRSLPPQGNGGLFSTPRDYLRFCRMLLAGGTLDGRRYLGERGMQAVSTVQTGDMPTGFFQSEAAGGLGGHYGWGLGTCVLKMPHAGVASMLSPGTFGHGGAWGTQAWIDPVRGVTYLLFVQRSNFPNSDGSDVRRRFQDAAAKALFPQGPGGSDRPGGLQP
ncbi:MAG: class A beta-lactamase-related serine hydrolase [Planctomycetia bacterium]|nr:class A beta-lactamase-related serine hydrolase [Planctomycetia bacterium]